MVNAAEAYKRQQVLTATPEALTLMLYNGALRFMTEGREAIEKKKTYIVDAAMTSHSSRLMMSNMYCPFTSFF